MFFRFRFERILSQEGGSWIGFFDGNRLHRLSLPGLCRHHEQGGVLEVELVDQEVPAFVGDRHSEYVVSVNGYGGHPCQRRVLSHHSGHVSRNELPVLAKPLRPERGGVGDFREVEPSPPVRTHQQVSVIPDHGGFFSEVISWVSNVPSDVGT